MLLAGPKNSTVCKKIMPHQPEQKLKNMNEGMNEYCGIKSALPLCNYLYASPFDK